MTAKLLGKLLEMADKKYRIGVERYKYVFEQLEQLKVQEMIRLQEYMVDYDDDNDDDDLRMDEKGGVTSKRLKSLENLFRMFEGY